MAAPFADRIDHYRQRVVAYLEHCLPAETTAPAELHAAMRYAVLNDGKRVRPLLVYATGECLNIENAAALDAPAGALELIHAFSLIHDDLPAMDDDDLRRGLPTVHRQFGEAIAILAGDALLPLAFNCVAGADSVPAANRIELTAVIASASGSLGMTGGQAIDLASEGKVLTIAELEHMQQLKTGALLHACVVSACCLAELSPEQRIAMDRFGRSIGLAFQIRDDLLDVEGDTSTIGKSVGADQRLGKATWPAIVGVDESKRRCDALLRDANDALDSFGSRADPLRWLANYIVARER